MAELDPLSPAEQKQRLRTRTRARRRERAAMGPQVRATDGDGVAQAVLTLCDALGLAPHATLAGYVALPTEPPTHEVTRRLHERGTRLIAPVLLPDKDLDWRLLRPDDDTRPEPSGPDLGLHAIEAAELIVVPALMLDRDGGRLGQGGGSYDRALRRRHPHAVVAGVVYDEELSERPLPRQEHDQRVDIILTASGRWLPRRGFDLA